MGNPQGLPILLHAFATIALDRNVHLDKDVEPVEEMAMKDWGRVSLRLAMIVLFFVFAHAAFAAASKGVREAPACGLDNVSYSVHLNDNSAPDAPSQPGKALVYFIQDGGTGSIDYPTTRMALDGNWVGANHGDSYFAVGVDPGEHHVCATLQTSLMGQRVELAHFSAEAGKAYYFRTRLILSSSVELLEFAPIDSDQGSYLAGIFPLSESKPKK
jgi:hypothetical protein